MTARRGLAEHALALAGSAVDLATRVKKGGASGPLVLAIRATSGLVGALAERPMPPPTAAQRLALSAAAGQLRGIASRVLPSEEGRDPRSLEFAVAQLIARTLVLIELASREAPAIAASERRSLARRLIQATGQTLSSGNAPRDSISAPAGAPPSHSDTPGRSPKSR